MNPIVLERSTPQIRVVGDAPRETRREVMVRLLEASSPELVRARRDRRARWARLLGPFRMKGAEPA